MERDQRYANPRRLPSTGGLPLAVLRAADTQLARSYAAWAGSSFGQRFSAPLAGAFLAFFVVMKAIHVTQLINGQLLVGTAIARMQFWPELIHQILGLVFTLLMVLLVGIRKPAQQLVKSFGAGVVALAGTFATFALVVERHSITNGALVGLASIFLIGGMGFSIWSLVTLGRCFSIMPEVRGLVTSGPYSRIRHPLYLGEIVAVFGVLLPALSTRNVAVFVAFCLLQLLRTRYEEATLSATFPDYAEYRRRTARIIPGLF